MSRPIASIRTINRPDDEQDAVDVVEIKPGIFTTEFWAMLGGIVLNLLTVLAAIGYLKPEDADTLQTSLGAILAAAQALIVNGAIIWQYIKSRTASKTELVKQCMEYRQAIRIEKMRMSMQVQESREGNLPGVGGAP